VAIGSSSSASVDLGTAVGAGSTVSAANGAAFGQASTASGASSTAIGQGAVAAGLGTVALGTGAQALTDNSIAIGAGTQSFCKDLTAIGYLADGNPGDCATTGMTDTVLVIGNGFVENKVAVRRNALMVKKSGHIEISGDVNILGNINIKGTVNTGHVSLNSNKPWWESAEGTFLYQDGLMYVVTSKGGSKTLAYVPVQPHSCAPGTLGCPCWLGACQASMTCGEAGFCVKEGILEGAAF